ncbi:hypothetical protein ACFX11_000826 [Malus domestica]
MLHCFTRILRTSEENHVLTQSCSQSKLIKCQALSFWLLNLSLRSLLASSLLNKKTVQLDEKLEIDIIGLGHSVICLLALTFCHESIPIVATVVEAWVLGTLL